MGVLSHMRGMRVAVTGGIWRGSCIVLYCSDVRCFECFSISLLISLFFFLWFFFFLRKVQFIPYFYVRGRVDATISLLRQDHHCVGILGSTICYGSLG